MSLQDNAFAAVGVSTTAKSRSGSALLIVLGMLAFMIVSAVAFAAYMRFSRLPSSYLRRTAASRQLVKAALARAIDEIDASIGNNPHPGVGTKPTRYPLNTEPDEGEVGVSAERNIWLHRVFFGSKYAVAPEETVSPLTLEALAYIPTPLVNEARYFSRRSPAAVWKSLGFDAGRYAFCALDVSDYFDVNRMMANSARSSAGNRRISLAYLFEKEDGHTSPDSSAAEWDSWMDNFRDFKEDNTLDWSSSRQPFVSLADFNLALGYKGGIGKMKSQFYSFIKPGSRKTFYEGGDESLMQISRMTFVTDGLFPSEDETGLADDEKTYDLSNPENQPFRLNPRGGRGPSLIDILLGVATKDNDERMWWNRRLSSVGLAALYDYLDPDHVPVSLALPTTERVPMICGIQPLMDGAKLKINKVLEYTENNGQDGNGDPKSPAGPDEPARTVEQVVHYRIDPDALKLMGGAVNAVCAYPFSKDAGYSEKFSLDGRLSLFFSTTRDMGLRTGHSGPTKNEALHITDAGKFTTGVDANGLVNIELKASDLPFNTQKAPRTENDAVKDASIPLMSGGVGDLARSLRDRNDLISVKYTWNQTPRQNGYATGGLASYEWGPKLNEVLADNSLLSKEPEYDSSLCIVNERGQKQNVKAVLTKGEIYLNLAVWMRVKSKNEDKIVDMVPACIADDLVANPSVGEQVAMIGAELGSYYPLMRFDTAGKGENVRVPLALAELDKMVEDKTELDISLWPQSAIVADPRFNHAPENWFALESNLSKSKWLEENHSADQDRDGDIFMEVSDSGYLQSKYELAMLPACASLSAAGKAQMQGNLKLFTTYKGKSIPELFSDAVQEKSMWKTYDPIEYVDEFEDMRWVGDKKGYRVNPYSDSTNVIMAVFANTPLNWACASTNDVEDAQHLDDADDAASFNKKYAWNSYSDGAKIAWEDLEAVAGNFMAKVREKGANWQDAWDELRWYDDDFCGVQLSSETSELWNVDRKFLYGYWKECFDVRQQLFLVFVRAEPVMMGGGGRGQVPPQLGARAVALVWRNPSSTNRRGEPLQEGSPHQTRVLFYRQLD